MENTAIWSKAIRFLLLGSTRAILITRLCRPSKNTIFMCSVAVQFDQNVMENLIDQSKLHLYGQLKRDVWHSFFAHLWPRVYQVTPPPLFSAWNFSGLGGAELRAVTDTHCSPLRADQKLSNQWSCGCSVLVLRVNVGQLQNHSNVAA